MHFARCGGIVIKKQQRRRRHVKAPCQHHSARVQRPEPHRPLSGEHLRPELAEHRGHRAERWLQGSEPARVRSVPRKGRAHRAGGQGQLRRVRHPQPGPEAGQRQVCAVRGQRRLYRPGLHRASGHRCRTEQRRPGHRTLQDGDPRRGHQAGTGAGQAPGRAGGHDRGPAPGGTGVRLSACRGLHPGRVCPASDGQACLLFLRGAVEQAVPPGPAGGPPDPVYQRGAVGRGPGVQYAVPGVRQRAGVHPGGRVLLCPEPPEYLPHPDQRRLSGAEQDPGVPLLHRAVHPAWHLRAGASAAVQIPGGYRGEHLPFRPLQGGHRRGQGLLEGCPRGRADPHRRSARALERHAGGAAGNGAGTQCRVEGPARQRPQRISKNNKREAAGACTLRHGFPLFYAMFSGRVLSSRWRRTSWPATRAPRRSGGVPASRTPDGGSCSASPVRPWSAHRARWEKWRWART